MSTLQGKNFQNFEDFKKFLTLHEIQFIKI